MLDSEYECVLATGVFKLDHHMIVGDVRKNIRHHLTSGMMEYGQLILERMEEKGYGAWFKERSRVKLLRQKQEDSKDMEKEWYIYKEAVMKNAESVYVVGKLSDKVFRSEIE